MNGDHPDYSIIDISFSDTEKSPGDLSHSNFSEKLLAKDSGKTQN